MATQTLVKLESLLRSSRHVGFAGHTLREQGSSFSEAVPKKPLPHILYPELAHELPETRGMKRTRASGAGGTHSSHLQQWFTVLERYHPTTCTISNLIVGNSYSFRVFSENLCGLSASAAATKELANIQKAGVCGPHQMAPQPSFPEYLYPCPLDT